MTAWNSLWSVFWNLIFSKHHVLAIRIKYSIGHNSIFRPSIHIRNGAKLFRKSSSFIIRWHFENISLAFFEIWFLVNMFYYLPALNIKWPLTFFFSRKILRLKSLNDSLNSLLSSFDNRVKFFVFFFWNLIFSKHHVLAIRIKYSMALNFFFSRRILRLKTLNDSLNSLLSSFDDRVKFFVVSFLKFDF